MNYVSAQDMASHKWKNRILLVLTDDINSTVHKNQIKELQVHETGLKERKLIVYQISKDKFKIGLTENRDWQKSTQLYEDYKQTKATFEVFLIGLDGSVKLREIDLISCKKLFGVIDGMPMRKSELNNK
jgi:predicted NACHT family NTPase